ncbi:MAG: DUF523 domain-containing protein [Lachnospiraceae bacterium]
MCEKENILISACLLGVGCRYDGGNNYISLVEQLKERYHLIPICSEIYGGLTTPRIPAERVGDKVLNRAGEDVTPQFKRGANAILKLAEFYDCRCALLKENSPSCGYGSIYDGSFSGNRVPGNGMLAELLSEHGIWILGESRVKELLVFQ